MSLRDRGGSPQKGKDMARIFKLTLELWPANEYRPNTCVEVHETRGRARPNRILHFALHDPPSEADLEWLCEVVGLQIRTSVGQTIGTQTELEFE
jgi:hypothetical protein